MGLLRLMGNKADVVKGLAKRCNENWRVAPTSDIVSFNLHHAFTTNQKIYFDTGSLLVRYSGPFDYDDAEFESLRKDSFALTLELSRANLN